MKKIQTHLEGLYIIENFSHIDHRGIFKEMWERQKMHNEGLIALFNQDNISISKKNVIRGLHFQIEPFAQLKFVQVIKGKIIDVAVDIRKKSNTFGQHISIELSEENQRGLWIPKGFAHGFSVLEDDTIVNYKCEGEYTPSQEKTIKWDDKDLNINWQVTNPIISEKDKKTGMSLIDI